MLSSACRERKAGPTEGKHRRADGRLRAPSSLAEVGLFLTGLGRTRAGAEARRLQLSLASGIAILARLFEPVESRCVVRSSPETGRCTARARRPTRSSPTSSRSCRSAADIAVLPPFPYVAALIRAHRGSAPRVRRAGRQRARAGRLHGRSVRRDAEGHRLHVSCWPAIPSGASTMPNPTIWSRASSSSTQGAGLVPILCVGETLDERDGGATERVIARQLDAVVARAGIEAFGACRPRLRAGLGDRHRPDRHAGAGPGGPSVHP